MPIDFHDSRNRASYIGRTADAAWLELIDELAGGLAGKRAADLGCGGGIYTEALLRLGAAAVTAVDFSAEMTAAAAEYLGGRPEVRIVRADAGDTGLPAAVDFVLARALIHHMPDPGRVFREAHRLLAPGGMLVVQDRTAEDCLLPGSPAHLRGFFFERHPKLIAIEQARRPQDMAVRTALRSAGFTRVNAVPFAEPRRTYASFEQLREELLARRGRSILHALSDDELAGLTGAIGRKLADAGAAWPLAEHDRWTIWTARKPASAHD